MQSKKIIVTIPFSQIQKEELESINPKWDFHYRKPKDLTPEDIKDCNIILGNLSVELLKSAEQLEWLQLNSAGTEPYSNKGVLSDQVILTNAGGAYGTAVSEHMLAMFLAIQKKLLIYRDNQNKHLWKSQGLVNSLHDLNVLVVGLGDIGLSFSKKMFALGNKITGIKRTIKEKPDYIDKIYTMDHLDALIPDADVIALCLPSTPETDLLFSKHQFSLMKKNAVLVNGGRGRLIDTMALYEALQNEQFLGAGLDVTDPEPLPEDHPLWDMKNVLITPHISGGFHLPETLNNIYKISLNNLKAYGENTELTNLIKR